MDNNLSLIAQDNNEIFCSFSPDTAEGKKALYKAITNPDYRITDFVGKEIEVVCDGIDYEKGCFVGRAYFSAPDIDGKVYFYAGEAMQGETYSVLIDRADCYDLFGHTNDYEGEI
jgi:hypothetical protein